MYDLRIFKDIEHSQSYDNFIKKANVAVWDIERKCLFYLLSLLEDTRNHIEDLYNFNQNCIEPEGLSRAWQTGGSLKVTLLAFNLYNNYSNDDFDLSPMNLFSIGEDYIEYLLKAVEYRLS